MYFVIVFSHNCANHHQFHLSERQKSIRGQAQSKIRILLLTEQLSDLGQNTWPLCFSFSSEKCGEQNSLPEWIRFKWPWEAPLSLPSHHVIPLFSKPVITNAISQRTPKVVCGKPDCLQFGGVTAVTCHKARDRNSQLPESQCCLQPQPGLGSQHQKFHKAGSILGFSTWTFFLLTFLNFSSTNQNATLILKLEGPIRIPSDRTLELTPAGTQGFAWGGGGAGCVCANLAKVPCGNATDGSKASQQGRVSKASQWIC